MSQVYVVVINYNSANYTTDCLRSLRNDRGRWVIYDNGSSPGDLALLQKELNTSSRASLLASETNLGFGAAFNAALTAINPDDDDVIWLLNPDTTVQSGTLDTLLEELDRLSGALAFVSPMVTTPGPRHDVVWFRGGTIDRIAGRSVHVDMGKYPIGGPGFDTQFLSGAAVMATAQSWRTLGGFREDLFLYWEDVDLSLRVSEAGGRMRVVPNARILHFEGGSSRNGSTGRSALFYYYYARNRLLVSRSGLVSRLDTMFIRGGRTSIREVAVILVKERQGRPVKLLSFLRGCLDGLSGRAGMTWRAPHPEREPSNDE